jgi:hypothetical protein
MAPDGRVVALTLVRTNGGEQFGVARLFRYTTAGNRDGTSAAAMVRSTSPGQARPIGATGSATRRPRFLASAGGRARLLGGPKQRSIEHPGPRRSLAPRTSGEG